MIDAITSSFLIAKPILSLPTSNSILKMTSQESSTEATTSSSTSNLTSALASTSIHTNHSDSKGQKRVQVIGQPPPAPPNNSIPTYDSDDSADESNRNKITNGKAKAQEEDDEAEVETEKDSKQRVKLEGDVDDEELLATYDGTEEVSNLLGSQTLTRFEMREGFLKRAYIDRMEVNGQSAKGLMALFRSTMAVKKV